MELQLSGLASGFDWLSLVDQVANLERASQRRLIAERSVLQQRQTAYRNIVTELQALQTRAAALKDLSLFSQRSTALNTFGVATASAAAGTMTGQYTFSFSQLATAARQVGGANAGASLNPTNNVSGLVLADAAFATAISAGTFTVNGAPVSIATTDTLQAVFDKINTATGGAVTGSYNAATDKITLSSAGAISLGSASDTSNFLQVARLSNNGTGTVSSALALGVVKQGAALASANFATPVSDGGGGAGAFKINGVTIEFNATTDSLSTVLGRINESVAGVVAHYDSVADQVILTNRATGDIGIALQDVTGNFLAATRLLTSAGGALEAGQDLQYTVNGGATLTSRSNTVTAESHGIAGLTVNALSAGTPAGTTPNSSTGFPQLVEFFGTAAGAATRMRTLPDHSYQTGFAVRFASTGTLPSMINADTIYYVRRIDADDISIHLTAADAASGANPINFGTNPPYTGDAYVIQVNPLTNATPATPGEVTVTVESDSTAVKTAITAFIEQYNKVQTLISAQTASSTDENGQVTAGILAGDSAMASLASELRRSLFGSTGLSGTIQYLSQLGYQTNGNDDTITLQDTAKLDAALASNLSGVRELLANTTSGLAVTMDALLERMAGDDGQLVSRQGLMTRQSAGLDDRVAELEKIVQTNRQRLINTFIAMEKAQAQMNQQLQFLMQQLGGTTK